MSTNKVVYAIKPLAGGRVDPDAAFTYVFNFEIEGCMVGVADKYELEKAVETVKRIK
jgi:hypothetical protein